LYHCALARAKADWFVGLNVTRALTTKFNAQLSAGRVQTPTLALIVEREEQISKFVAKQYYNIKIKLDGFFMLYHDKKSQTRIFDKNIAENLRNNLKGKDVIITKAQKTDKKESVPMLYDLTELQRDANKRYNFSSKANLANMQDLYEDIRF
jgi:DNA topoisomerase-3